MYANRSLASRGTTIFTVMSALAAEHQAINLGQGFPDEDGPASLRARAAKALIEESNQYPPMMGLPALRQAIARHSERQYGIVLDWQSEVLVTSGATEAITDCLLAFLNPGDEAVLIEPAYDSYRPVIEAIGAKVRSLTLRPPLWTFEAAALKAAITPKTRLLVLNSPLNPAGKVFSLADLDAIAEIARQHDLLVVCDEVYEHLTFDGIAHTPLLTRPGMADRCVRIGSAGKIFSLTGWKIGWVTGPAALISLVAKAHQFVTFTTPPALQAAIAHGLEHDGAYYLGLSRVMQDKRDMLAHGLSRAGFEVLPCQGTYFVTANFWALAPQETDIAFAERLTREARVAAIPLSVFYQNDAPQHLIRFAFCKRDDVLKDACARLLGAMRR